jgi:hypothetical protein
MGDTDFDTRLKTYLAAKAAVEQKTKDEAAASAASERSQTAGFRVKLFQLITWLTIISFTFLVLVIIFKMIWKIRHPEYEVLSDMVINILAVGVFAELVGVVGIIARLLWQK